MITPKLKHKISVIARFIVIWSLFGSIYAIIEYGLLGNSDIYPSTQNYYNGQIQYIYIISGSAFLGLIVGLFEVVIFPNLFIKRSFSFKIIFKSVLYSILIASFLLIIGSFVTSIQLGVSMIGPEVLESQWRFINSFAFYSIFIFISFCFIISLFIFEISKSLGIMIFYNFLTGKYHKPRVEDRVFMFMDMNSSTTIAEELGHVKYYQLLNKYYSDMSDAIINTFGEIYQYVGDEVVISWPIDKGVQDSNCIRCFYEIKLSIASNEAWYKDKFGVIPTFKAAIHCGSVTTGEIGELKKEIVFTGDVLNTTSRIQHKCNYYKAELLASQRLLDKLPTHKSFTSKVIGEIELKGKNQKVLINKLSLL